MIHGTLETFQKRCKIFTALQFYGHGSYQKIVGQNFFIPMSQPSVSRRIAEVTKAILLKMFNFVLFPKTSEEIQKCKSEFMAKTAFPGVVGCVDGMYRIYFQWQKTYLKLYYRYVHILV